MRGLLLAVVILAALLVIGCDGRDGDASDPRSTSADPNVPMLRGNAAHTGVNPGPGVEGSPKVLWRFDTGRAVQSSPAVVDGLVYISSADYVYALDAASGQELWRFETGGNFSSPAVVEGTVYVGGGLGLDDDVYALDARTGRERWRFDAEGEGASAAVSEGVVYISNQDGRLYALDAGSGRERWRFEDSDDTVAGYTSSPAVADGTVYWFTGSYSADADQGHLYALDAATGEERWRFKMGYSVTSRQVV